MTEINPVKQFDGIDHVAVLLKSTGGQYSFVTEYAKCMRVLRKAETANTMLFKVASAEGRIYYCEFNPNFHHTLAKGLVHESKDFIDQDGKIALCRVFASVLDGKLRKAKYSRADEFLKHFR